MPRISYFDLPVDAPERAIKFYSTVFGWEFKKWDGPFDYWLIKTGEKDELWIDGGLAKRENPNDSLTPFITVDLLDEYLNKITSNDGEIIKPKSTIPGVGYMSIIKDTENNIFGLIEEDKSAK